MEIETTLTKDIRIAAEKAGYDAACKKLLSEKIILAWIMKDCMSEFRNVDVKDIAEKYIEGSPAVSEVTVDPDEKTPSRITGTGSEDAMVNEGTITYDIRFFAKAPRSDKEIWLIINVEAQNDFYPGYPLIKRGVYYCSRMISSQYGTEFTESHYEKIKKVYTIWICMNPPKNRRNSITRYYIKEDNLIGNVREPIEHYDLITAIMICLGDTNDDNYYGILKLLNILLSNEINQKEKCRILQDDFDIPMSQTLERKVSLMCNLSEGVWAKAMEKGMAEGLEKGMTEGLEKGLEKGVLESVRNLMDTMKLTAEQAMIALKVPEADRTKYFNMLR
ncbi:MAG: Rpn family recombination-promoting nuclease/putative transposase [Clostridiales bacterium]|nr:Rpn family recombination-promoting nuclease/putative transposase [Clostridiales bacterium]